MTRPRAEAIVALDVPTLGEAMALVDRLGDAARFYKVGNQLFTAEGPAVVRALRDRGCDVFLDLKFHDIPNTVAQGVASARRLGARLVTVHALGGSAMLEAAVQAAGSDVGILAVTVLTSHDAAGWSAVVGGDAPLADEVLRLAALAKNAGAHGVVCSGEEVERVRAEFGEALAPLIPGIRLSGGAAHDQKRIVTPADAVKRGARYLVVGRAVTAAEDPAVAMRSVAAEMGAAD